MDFLTPKKGKAKDVEDLPLKKIILATVDIGGNSISLEFRRADKPLKKINILPPKYKRHCGLARSINKSGLLEPPSVDYALEALSYISKQIKFMRQQGHHIVLDTVGTAPFRDAKNGQAFAEEIKSKTDLNVTILSGDEEAISAAKGVLAHFPEVSGIVADSGGGSTEFSCIQKGEIIDTFSLPLGMLRIQTAKDAQAYIEHHLKDLPDSFFNQNTLIGTGGTYRALAKSYAHTHNMKLKKGPMIGSNDFSAYTNILAKEDTGRLADKFQIDEKRAVYIEPAALLFDALKEKIGAQQILLNKATMRDGRRAIMLEQIAQIKEEKHVPSQQLYQSSAFVLT